MWSVIFSSAWGFFGGMVAWFSLNFVGAQILDVSNLRKKVRAELHFYTNISVDNTLPALTDEEREASLTFRRIASDVTGLSVSQSWPVSIYLQTMKIDLEKAAVGLIGFSNTITRTERVVHRDKIEEALALPRTNPPDYVATAAGAASR